MPKKILVSDPYPDEAETLKQMLENNGYEVSVGGDSLKDCVPFLLVSKYDLMLIREEYVVQRGVAEEDLNDGRTRVALLRMSLTGEPEIAVTPSMVRQQIQRVFEGDASLRDSVKEILQRTPRLFLAPINHPIFGDTRILCRQYGFDFIETNYHELPDNKVLIREIGKYVKP